jgi:hypothetical protein
VKVVVVLAKEPMSRKKWHPIFYSYKVGVFVDGKLEYRNRDVFTGQA